MLAKKFENKAEQKVIEFEDENQCDESQFTHKNTSEIFGDDSEGSFCETFIVHNSVVES